MVEIAKVVRTMEGEVEGEGDSDGERPVYNLGLWRKVSDDGE